MLCFEFGTIRMTTTGYVPLHLLHQAVGFYDYILIAPLHTPGHMIEDAAYSWEL